MLLDEVGTGTDPVEGAALGVAILRALARGGDRGAALTLATTHHRHGPDLAALAAGDTHCRGAAWGCSSTWHDVAGLLD